jgi:hypothetical protein
MSSFLYFVPDAIVTGVGNLPEATGLRAILGTGSFSAFPVAEFVLPTGMKSGGTLVAMPNDPADLVAIRQDEQTWTPVIKDEKTTHWIGVWKAAPPTPFDLKRPEGVAGSMLKLGEHEWEIPVIHPPLQSTLPSVFKMTGAGPVFEPKPEYHEIQKASLRFFEWIMELATVPEKETEQEKDARLERAPKDIDSMRYVASVMGINYRVGLWELSVLGIIDTAKVSTLIFHSLGLKQRLDQIEASKNF